MGHSPIELKLSSIEKKQFARRSFPVEATNHVYIPPPDFRFMTLLRREAPSTPFSSPVPSNLRPSQARLLIRSNPSLCSTCLSCQLACSLFHEGECNLSLARLHIFHDPLAGSDNLIELCKQCLAPSCLYACPIPGAFQVDEATGARIIDEEKCVGCGRCAKACPLNERGTIIRPHPRKRIYIKCDLCRKREKGPLCVEVCPWGALTLVVMP